MKPAGRSNARNYRPFLKDRNSIESAPKNRLLYEDDLKHFQQPRSHSNERMVNSKQSVEQMTQDFVQDPTESANCKGKVQQTLNKIFTDVEACGDEKLISDLREFLGSRNYNLSLNQSATPLQLHGLSNLQYAKVSSTYDDSVLETETVKPNSPVDTFSCTEYTLQEDRMNTTDLQQYIDLRTLTQQSQNIQSCHDSADQPIQCDQNLQENKLPTLKLGDGHQDHVIDDSGSKIPPDSPQPSKSSDILARSGEREPHVSIISDCAANFDNDQCLQLLQSSCADDLILLDKVTPENISHESLLVDPDEVMRHLNERDASFYDRVYISSDISNSPGGSSLIEAGSPNNDECTLPDSLPHSNIESHESSCQDESFPDSVSTNDCNIESVKNSVKELCIEECNAGHAFKDSSCKVTQSDSLNNNDESVSVRITNTDHPCNLTETICIANVTTNSMSTSNDNSKIVSSELVPEDDSLLKLEVINDESKYSSSMVLNKKKKHVQQADNTNQFDSSTAGKRSKNSSETQKSNTDESVIDKLHGLRWLKSPETSSDSDMARKKLKKKVSLPLELSTEENDQGDQASKPSTAQQNNSRRQSTAVPLQLTPNTEPLSVWSSTNAAQQLFPKPQTPPLEKLKEDEEYHLACAESMSTYEKEIELRKMAGVFPKTENLDKTNDDKSNILKNIPEHLRRDTRQGDSNNNESRSNSQTNKPSNSDKRPVIGRGPKADQEFPPLATKGNSFKNKSNSHKKNHPDNNKNASSQQPIQDENIQPNSAPIGSLENSAQSDYRNSHSDPTVSNLNEKTPNDSQDLSQKIMSQNEDHSNSLDDHPYRNVNSFIDTNGQGVHKKPADNSGHQFGNPLTNSSKNQEQYDQKSSDYKNSHCDRREQDSSTHRNYTAHEYPRQNQRVPGYDEQGTRGRNQNTHGHASDRYNNQSSKPRENHHESRTSYDQNRDYNPRSRNDSENFDLPYMNQNLNTKNNYSNRNQAYNQRENDHPYRNQDRHDYRGSDRNRVNNNHPNNFDPNSDSDKNQRYQTNRYQNSSHKSFDNRSQERHNSNPNHNYNCSKPQAWTPETRRQNNNPSEENWDEDIDAPRSQKSCISTPQQASDRKIHSSSSQEHETFKMSTKELQSISSQAGKAPFMPQDSSRSSKSRPVIDSSSQMQMNIPEETENSEISEISFGDCSTPPPQDRGVRAKSVDANIPVLPQYLPPGLYQQMNMPRPGLSSNPLMLPGSTAINVNPQSFEMVRTTQSLNMANPQVAAMGSSVVPVNPCLLPTGDIANPQVMNEMSHNSQEIMRLHEKVNRLSKELQTTQAELLAAQAKSFHQVYVTNPALQNLVMNQDVVPSAGSQTPLTPSDSMPAKCATVPPNLQALSHNLQSVNPAVNIDPAMLTRLHLESLYMQHGNFHLTQSAAHFTNNADCNLNSISMGKTQSQNNQARGKRGSNINYDQ